MMRRARAAFVYDTLPVLECLRGSTIPEDEIKECIRSFLEYQLFKVAGFNLVWTIPERHIPGPYHRYLDWKISPADITRLFDVTLIPADLRQDECYLYLRDESALIAYF